MLEILQRKQASEVPASSVQLSWNKPEESYMQRKPESLAIMAWLFNIMHEINTRLLAAIHIFGSSMKIWWWLSANLSNDCYYSILTDMPDIYFIYDRNDSGIYKWYWLWNLLKVIKCDVLWRRDYRRYEYILYSVTDHSVTRHLWWLLLFCSGLFCWYCVLPEESLLPQIVSWELFFLSPTEADSTSW